MLRTPIGVALARLADQCPNQPAITCGHETITRSELDLRTNRLARAYQALGARQGTLVSIGLPNGLSFIESVLAIWKLGAVPQPISHRLPSLELQAILELAEPSLVIGPSAPGRNCVPADFVPDVRLSHEPLPALIAPYLKAPTSGGSTGLPKLVVSTDEATAESLDAFRRLVRLPEKGTALSTGPLSHNGPLFTSAAALLAGCHLIIMERFDAAQALKLIGQHGVNWMYTVPTMLSRIANLPSSVREDAVVSTLETVITMAAHCPEHVRAFCLAFFGTEVMLELFSTTEAQAIVMIDGAGWRDRPGSVGLAVVGQIQARRADGTFSEVGEVGQLWMRRSAEGPAPYRYWGAVPESAEGGWETVGDLGWFDADGYLYLADRRSDMIVTGGLNVYPAEVEAALEEHDAVDAACVVGVPDDEYGQRVHAVLNLKSPVADSDLTDHVRGRLAPYKIPRGFDRVDDPLRDEAGKTRRSRVRSELLTRRNNND